MSMFPVVLCTSFHFHPKSLPPQPIPTPQWNWMATANVLRFNLDDEFPYYVHIGKALPLSPLTANFSSTQSEKEVLNSHKQFRLETT